MSDFLTNLLSRSRGTSEVVRPRLPSLFEPYQRGSGLLGTRPPSPTGDASSESPVETGHEDEANPTPITQRNNPLAKSPRTQQGQPVDEAAEEQPTEGVRPPAQPATLTPRPGTRPGIIAANPLPGRQGPSNGLKSLQRRSLEPILPSAIAQPDVSELMVNHKDPSRRETATSITDAGGVTQQELVRPPRSPDIKSVPIEASIPHEDRHPRTAPPRGRLEPLLVTHPDSLVARVMNPPVDPERRDHQESPVTLKFNPPIEPPRKHDEDPQHAPIKTVVNLPAPPSLLAHLPPQAAGSIRPPLPSRAEGTRGIKSPEPVQSARPSQPSIQVSIGRVEVRAVFPEAPARRPPAPRSRPTVSLDDYLNQRNRGRR
jgi:hypothetical protein